MLLFFPVMGHGSVPSRLSETNSLSSRPWKPPGLLVKEVFEKCRRPGRERSQAHKVKGWSCGTAPREMLGCPIQEERDRSR